jgi:hypothetical protein
MNLTVILTVAVILSVAFHFVGVYAGAKKIVWIMLVIAWAGSINIAMSEIKPKGYEEIQKMKGKYPDTDTLIQEAGETVSVYEMLGIKKSFMQHKHNKD